MRPDTWAPGSTAIASLSYEVQFEQGPLAWPQPNLAFGVAAWILGNCVGGSSKCVPRNGGKQGRHTRGETEEGE